MLYIIKIFRVYELRSIKTIDLTCGTITFGSIAFAPEYRVGFWLCLQLFLHLAFQPLHKNIRRFLDTAAGFQTGDSRLQTELAINQYTGYGKTENAKDAHNPIDAYSTRMAGLVAELPRHRHLQAG